MKIGLLLCDDVKPHLQETFTNYPDMFAELLLAHDPSLELQTWRVIDQQFPEHTDECDGWLISGSRHSANDDFPWVKELKIFIHKLYQEQRKLIGICFGHQVIAAALEGQVSLAQQGWGIGVYSNQLTGHRRWMSPKLNALRLRVSHKEQITRLPDTACVLAKSTFCPNYMVAYGDCFMSIQGHPEFSEAYSKALMLSRKDMIPAERLEDGLNSLQHPVHGHEVAQWMLAFFNDQNKSLMP